MGLCCFFFHTDSFALEAKNEREMTVMSGKKETGEGENGGERERERVS